MSRVLIPLLGIGLIAGSGYLFAVQTAQWRDPAKLAQGAKRLEALPRTFDGWRSKPAELSDRELRGAEASGGVAATFERQAESGSSPSVRMMLLCGPSGPIALHPPTVCFQGVGYRQTSESKRVEVSDAAGRLLGTFWATDFERDGADGLEKIRTWWGWTTNGIWSAPSQPRFEFAGKPILYKLYLTQRVDGETDDTGIREFASEWLPRLSDTVFQGLKPEGQAAA